ncbi:MULTISPECIES: arginyltransferase [unclassified Campylobacter]|uniref:arginyltransferase n=1 Tax=unclassified Campylobacter TaxID=2593542 RepID=UPI001237ECCE|nr:MULTISPECIES: arginyltransferase [unclassified Campylobacter]KAA6224658.1 arginyltransferase [Campylobacter sp. LR185c]KAA6225658.1 arginyltransferase [Campylobacter sp. LR286c]KAA6229631.1 arginyltransferase [Campylobacter sp. LR291e]KAA6230124.1 arginyltransferase [Campylobacter sp. LR264d]KAA8604002.1 arginyltransferase [Campylobacter sp. LR185c]
MLSIDFCSLEDECPYLADKKSRMEFKCIVGCSKKLNLELVKRGWRRFGYYFSRPICKDCKECLNLRINVKNFEFSKSQKRVLRKNEKTKFILRKPKLTNEHIFLYDKYHTIMREKRGWKEGLINFEKYYNLYIANSLNFGFELDFYIDEKLVCVDFIDILEDSISSIYCFYDPDFSHLSLGKLSLLYELKLAKINKLDYIYLGYYVKNCQSLSYKADYTPNEILKGTFSLDEKVFLWES